MIGPPPHRSGFPTAIASARSMPMRTELALGGGHVVAVSASSVTGVPHGISQPR